MAVSKADILAALGQLVSALPEGEAIKKPSVKDVEAIVEGDVSAAERDEAWAEFQALDNTPEDNEIPIVTNNYKSAIAIAGVVIAPNESKAVPKFNADNSVMKRWIKEDVIRVN